MVLKECFLVNNDCYKKGQRMTDDRPTGIVVHSTGCNNKTLKRYVNPVKTQSCYNEMIADLGLNAYNNHWNRSSTAMKKSVCVHAFIGTNAKGKIETIQTLPFTYCAWGVGNGKKGSYNFNPTARIQFEICEDGLTDKTYFNKVMKEAQEFCAYLCKQYSLPVTSICSHNESYKQGYGTNHADCDHWLKKYGKNMDWFREEVKKILASMDLPDKVYKIVVGEYSNKDDANKIISALVDAGFTANLEIIEKEKM